MNIKIRSEGISDYCSIANVNYEAFLGWHPDNQYVSEPVLVDLLRHNSLFDPELSLVAEVDGKIAGHVFFSPFKFIVLGTEILGVVLAPVAVKPEFQKKGVGKALIEEGHRIAMEKGYDFSLLCGHTDYYPRFGYKTGMFSLSGVKVSIDMGGFDSRDFFERPVSNQDIPWMLEAWKSMHGTDAFALFPGENISEWSNQGLECRCTVLLKYDRVLGYIRYARSNTLNVKELLVKDMDVEEVLAYLAWKKYGRPQGEIHIALSIDKLQSALGNTGSVRVFDECSVNEAFMLKVLKEDSNIAGYCKQLEEGAIKPGIIVFPPMFDTDDGRVD